jgi:hypothetical protein
MVSTNVCKVIKPINMSEASPKRLSLLSFNAMIDANKVVKQSNVNQIFPIKMMKIGVMKIQAITVDR